ncbi:MAG TPA: 23S rRNA (guanosine(2251)-2'-O)-methyltransferase RlmB, partial [Mycobacterium sp.]
MAGNSRRRGAIRKSGTKKGPTVGSGGQRRRGLEGRGPTPPAHLRPNHPAAKRGQTQPR